jgi:hypothetical protein
MRKKEVDLTPRQIRFLSQVAQGLAVGEAARVCEYHTHHASKLYRSPEGQAFVAKMVVHAETELAAGLPELVQSALKALKDQLEGSNADRRLKAAGIVLKLAAPLICNLMNATDNRGNIFEMDFNQRPREASNEDTSRENNH